jgi:hypothetical protein
MNPTPWYIGVFGWMDEVGWDGVILFFIVFDWESGLSVRTSVKKSGINSSLKKSWMSSSHFIKHID